MNTQPSTTKRNKTQQQHTMKNENDTNTNDSLLDLIFDFELNRPACILLQAAYKCGSSPRALRHFNYKSWLTAPTKGMQRVSGTDAEWRQIAEHFSESNAQALAQPGRNQTPTP